MIVPKWVLKAIVQKGISYLPNPERVNLFFQKHVTKGVELNDEHFGYKSTHAYDHIKHFRDLGKTSADTEILELGTGWYPIIPAFMFLTESGRVTSVDIMSWMTKESQVVAFEKILEWREAGKLDQFNELIIQERWQEMLDVISNPQNYSKESIDELLGLTPLIQDARNMDLADGSFDLICSNNTFEHVYPDVLKGILKEFKRVIRKGGVMSHFIDMSDHFAHFDNSITIYNFLKYSEKQWKRIDNSVQPQNRLRLVQYKEMYQDLGIPITEEHVRPVDSSVLEGQEIHTELQVYSQEELAQSHAYLISVM